MNDSTRHLTLQGAAAVWLKTQTLPKRNCQFNRILSSMAKAVLAHGLAQEDTEGRLVERLEEALSILQDVAYGLGANLDDVDRAFEPLGQIWSHRSNIDDEFNRGYKSDSVAVNRIALAGAAAMLIERPWLDCRAVEYILVDALVCDEVRQFGRSVLDAAPFTFGGLSVNIDAGHQRGLDAVALGILWTRLTWWVTRLVAFLIAPAALIWLGVEQDVRWLIITGVVVLFGYLALSAVSVAKGLFRRLLNRPPPKPRFVTQMELWKAMSDAYRLMSGAVLDPAMVFKALRDAAAQGAVWDSAVYALMNRIVARNPNAWVTDDGYMPDEREGLLS